MDFSLENKDVDQFAISQNGRDLRDESKAPRETDVPFSLDERHPGSEPGIKLEALASDLPIGQRLNFDSSDGLGATIPSRVQLFGTNASTNESCCFHFFYWW